MDGKKSTVMRVPNELVERINQYGKALEKQGIRLDKTDLMRNFANNSITTHDNAKEALGKIAKYPKV